MSELALKERFARLLREVLRGSGMTRGELIARLGISASGMSQMLNGDILPTVQRLDRMIELMHPAADDAEKLQNMLLWLRSGSAKCPSEFNRRLFMARCQRAMTIEELAMASAIPAGRLRRLERTAYAAPTPDEVAALSGILGQPLRDGVFVSDLVPARTAPLEVADSAITALPMIDAESLGSYSARLDFVRFVEDHGIGFWPFYLLPAEAVAVVRAPSEKFGVALPGHLELVLGKDRPQGFTELDLCRAARGGGLFIDGDMSLYGQGLLAASRQDGRAAWRLPILQMNHIPDGGSNAQG